MNQDLKELCSLDINLYKCVTPDIATARVVLTEKSVLHIAEHHPDAYEDVLIELKETIREPDYIFKDDKHVDTALVIRRIASFRETSNSTFIVLRICTDTKDGKLANSIISGWEISDSRLSNYLRHKQILYKRS